MNLATNGFTILKLPAENLNQWSQVRPSPTAVIRRRNVSMIGNGVERDGPRLAQYDNHRADVFLRGHASSRRSDGPDEQGPRIG